MKKTYEKPGFDSTFYAQFENVFTYCDKNPHEACINVTGTGNDKDKPVGMDESLTSAHGNLPYIPGGGGGSGV